MTNAVRYFRGKNYCGNILEAKERRLPRSKSVPPPLFRKPIIQSFSETITISNSKYLKGGLEKKIELLNHTFPEPNIKVSYLFKLLNIELKLCVFFFTNNGK